MKRYFVIQSVVLLLVLTLIGLVLIPGMFSKAPVQEVLTGVSSQDRIEITPMDIDTPDGTRSAIKLTDNSDGFASLFQEVAIPDDTSMYKISMFFKAGTSANSQLLLHFYGGTPVTFYVFFNPKNGKVREDARRGAYTLKEKGGGWYEITLSGPNNYSGNKAVRVQVYPRHGFPEDTGSLIIAGAKIE